MSYYEEIFTRLNKASTVDEVVAIRDEAEVARIKARLAGDLQTETLAADIVARANQKSLSFASHHTESHGTQQRNTWVPLHSLRTNRR